MQKLWRLMEAAIPKVLAMGCWAHILNLFFTGHPARVVAQSARPKRHSTCAHVCNPVKQHVQDVAELAAKQAGSHQHIFWDADERSKLIKACVLSEPWWDLNNCLVELMVPVAQLLTAFQADHANLADVHYGLATVDKWFGDATRGACAALAGQWNVGAEPGHGLQPKQPLWHNLQHYQKQHRNIVINISAWRSGRPYWTHPFNPCTARWHTNKLGTTPYTCQRACGHRSTSVERS
ncbi:hypothetical protein V8C86DRAFT_2430902 [Haematococcus lacustris]